MIVEKFLTVFPTVSSIPIWVDLMLTICPLSVVPYFKHSPEFIRLISEH